MQDKKEAPRFEPAWVNAVEVFSAGLGHRKPGSVAGDLSAGGAPKEEIDRLVAVFEALEPQSGEGAEAARNVVARLAKESKEASHALTLEDPDGETTTVNLSGGTISIGRSPGNTVCLDDRNISRSHCEIFIEGEKVEIEDLSRYGTRHNGQVIQGRVPLRRGDVVQIGDFRMRISVLRRAADSPKAAEAVSTDIPAEQAARLVVTSSNFYGTEFSLTREQNIIGRVDADITIDHRSVSSWHAKVVRDGSSYKIVDLGSSNGVVVNGESYRASGLKHNDEIELGHVKLQFVGPGEEFRPRVSAQAAEGERRGGMGLLLAAAAVLLVGALGVGAVLLLSGGEGKESGGGSGLASAPSSAAAQPPAESGDDKQVADFVKRGHEAIQAEEWDRAMVYFDEALRVDPSHKDAQEQKSLAARERPFKEFFVKGEDALKAGRFEVALESFDKLPSVSLYHKRVEEGGLREKAREGLMGRYLADARSAMEGKQWRDARRSVRDALAMDEGSAEARQLLEEINRRDKKGAKEEVAVASRGANPNKANGGDSPAAGASPPPAEAAPEASAEDKKARRDELLKSARQKNLAGDLGGALADATESLKYGGGVQAYLVIAQISEKQGDTANAIKHYNLWLKASCAAKLAGPVRDKIIAMGGTPGC